MARVLRRDGEAITAQMERWLSQQEELFREEDSINVADFVLTTG
jgi:hypothetical protein